MSKEEKRTYLDKLGITYWIPRPPSRRERDLLMIHDEPADLHQKNASLITQLYKALSLNTRHTAFVSFQKDKVDIKPYLMRFNKVIIFGEDLSKQIDKALLNQLSERHVVTHRLSEGLTGQDKKSLFRAVSQWTF